ncbi:hypothetical protein QL285_058063 [Trifolium repens]|nr:hypothetical protein QL285_058063 [Trifolium repens]
MAGNRNENNGAPQPHAANGSRNNLVDGHFTNVTETEGSYDPTYNPNVPEVPFDIPPLAVRAPTEEIMAALVNAINRSSTSRTAGSRLSKNHVLCDFRPAHTAGEHPHLLPSSTDNWREGGVRTSEPSYNIIE